MCVCKTCESGIHSHPIYVCWGCTCHWGYPQFEKYSKTIKRGMYYPQRALEFIILICIGNKQTSFTPKKFLALQLHSYILLMCIQIPGSHVSQVGGCMFSLCPHFDILLHTFSHTIYTHVLTLNASARGGGCM